MNFNNINNNNNDDSINLISILSNPNPNPNSNTNPRGITSIQNMISQHLINLNNNNNTINFPNNKNSFQEYDNIISSSDSQSQSYPLTHSTLSLCQPYLSELIMAQPQFPVYFVCLYKKICDVINGRLMNERQSRLIIKGTWNILIKYWKDKNYIIFSDVGEAVEWGLLNLLKWGLNVGRKDWFNGQEMLRNCQKEGYYDEEENCDGILGQCNSQQEQENERRYFCTLEHIE